MHRGIMEALETRARDITMGIIKDKIHDRQNMKDIALGNLMKERKKSSRTRLIIHQTWKHFPDADMQDPQDSLMKSSSEGSLI